MDKELRESTTFHQGFLFSPKLGGKGGATKWKHTRHFLAMAHSDLVIGNGWGVIQLRISSWIYVGVVDSSRL